MAIGDLFRLSVLYNNPNSGCNAANVFAYRQELALVFDEPGEDLIEAFKAACEPSLIAVMSTDWQLVSYRVRGITDPSYGFDADQTGVQGQQVGEPLPPQTAQVISWKTGKVGKRFNGRTYLPTTTENSQTRGNLVPGQITALAGLADTLLAPDSLPLTATWQLGIFSGFAGFTPVTHGIVRPSLKTIRNRASTTG